MADEKQERRVNIEDLPAREQELSDEEAKDVKGGGLLLPAIQSAREAARRSSTSDDSASDNLVAGNRIGTSSDGTS